MNIQEHHILELEILREVKYDFSDEKFYEIRVKTDCWGSVEERTTIEIDATIERAKERGYFLW